MPTYKTKMARGASAISNDVPRLPDVLADCPAGYRLHSAVPIADGGGYTSHVWVVFESVSPTTAVSE